MPQINMKSMLDAGVHFGHQTTRWNPKMGPYVYSNRGGIHIIDLQKSVAGAHKAAEFMKAVAAKGGRVVFVGTKKQAVEPIKEAAQKCGQYYVTKRWLGGTLTNFASIKTRIDRLKRIEQMHEKGEINFYSKKERGTIQKEYEKLCAFLDGIKDMKDSPSALFVVDLNKEHIAVKEAKKLGIPVVGIADTNTDPTLVDYPIPGNDDAIRSIKLFTNLMVDSYLEGAKLYEERARSERDKSEEAESSRVKAAPVAEASGSDSGGPAIVKVSRGRKMVAAGLGEDAEIQMELDEETTRSEGDESEESES